jgi:hypothetical protein
LEFISFDSKFLTLFNKADKHQHRINQDDIARHRGIWSMKPQPVDADGWIKHDGGENPIPWAAKGEFEYRLRRGDCYKDLPSAGLDWPYKANHPMVDIVAFRLTQGWLPVKGDGTIPDGVKGAKAGEFEIKLRSGVVRISGNPIELWSGCLDHTFKTGLDIVAVRLIKKPISFNYVDCADLGSWEPVSRQRKQLPPPILPISQNEMLRIAGEAMRDTVKPGPVVECYVIAGLMR